MSIKLNESNMPVEKRRVWGSTVALLGRCLRRICSIGVIGSILENLLGNVQTTEFTARCSGQGSEQEFYAFGAQRGMKFGQKIVKVFDLLYRNNCGEVIVPHKDS